MWLTRGLSFTCKALQNTQANKTQELSTAFGSSYESTLKPFHGMFVRPVFAVSCITFFFFHCCRSCSPTARGGEAGRREGAESHSHRGSAASFFLLANPGRGVFDVVMVRFD